MKKNYLKIISTVFNYVHVHSIYVRKSLTASCTKSSGKGGAFNLNAVTPETPEQTHYFRPLWEPLGAQPGQVVALTVLNRVFVKVNSYEAEVRT